MSIFLDYIEQPFLEPRYLHIVKYTFDDNKTHDCKTAPFKQGVYKIDLAKEIENTYLFKNGIIKTTKLKTNVKVGRIYFPNRVNGRSCKGTVIEVTDNVLYFGLWEREQNQVIEVTGKINLETLLLEYRSNVEFDLIFEVEKDGH